MMSHAEIRTSYRQAKHPHQQIKILAELNDTSCEYIRRIVESDPTTPSKPPAKKWRYTDDEISEIVRLWNQNLSVEEIARQLNRPANSIQSYASHHRDQCPRRMAIITAQQKAEAFRRRASGESYRDIADKLGCSYSAVYTTIQKEEAQA